MANTIKPSAGNPIKVLNSSLEGITVTDDGNVQVKLGDDAGSKKLSVRDSGDVEVAYIDSDGVISGASGSLPVPVEGNVLIGDSTPEWALLDASADTKILVGNGTTLTSVALSGDVTMTNAGVTSIGATKVTKAMMENLTTGSIYVGSASRPVELDASGTSKILIGNGTTIASYALSGDVTMTNTGVVTIANDAVSLAKLANVTRGSLIVGGASDAPTLLSGKTLGAILIGDGTDITSTINPSIAGNVGIGGTLTVNTDDLIVNSTGVGIGETTIPTGALLAVGGGISVTDGASDELISMSENGISKGQGVFNYYAARAEYSGDLIFATLPSASDFMSQVIIFGNAQKRGGSAAETFKVVLAKSLTRTTILSYESYGYNIASIVSSTDFWAIDDGTDIVFGYTNPNADRYIDIHAHILTIRGD